MPTAPTLSTGPCPGGHRVLQPRQKSRGVQPGWVHKAQPPLPAPSTVPGGVRGSQSWLQLGAPSCPGAGAGPPWGQHTALLQEFPEVPAAHFSSPSGSLWAAAPPCCTAHSPLLLCHLRRGREQGSPTVPITLHSLHQPPLARAGPGGCWCPLPTLPRVSPAPCGAGAGAGAMVAVRSRRGGTAHIHPAERRAGSLLLLAQMLTASAWKDHKYLWPLAQAAVPVECLQPPGSPQLPPRAPCPMRMGHPSTCTHVGTRDPAGWGTGQPPDPWAELPPLPKVPQPLGCPSTSGVPQPLWAPPGILPLCAGVSCLGG